MSMKITEDCIACGNCEGECPNNAITMGAEYYKINANKCTECEGVSKVPQCADVCDMSAIIKHEN